MKWGHVYFYDTFYRKKLFRKNLVLLNATVVKIYIFHIKI